MKSTIFAIAALAGWMFPFSMALANGSGRPPFPTELTHDDDDGRYDGRYRRDHGRYHDELDHRRFHRGLEHREAHRYPMTPWQHEGLHDSLEHEDFHDRLEHRGYHREYDYPRYRAYRYPGYETYRYTPYGYSPYQYYYGRQPRFYFRWY